MVYVLKTKPRTLKTANANQAFINGRKFNQPDNGVCSINDNPMDDLPDDGNSNNQQSKPVNHNGVYAGVNGQNLHPKKGIQLLLW